MTEPAVLVSIPIVGFPATGSNVDRTRTCAFRMDRLMWARFHDGAEVDLADAKENLAATAKLASGKRIAVLVDLRPIRSQTAAARAYFASPEAEAVCAAVALVVGSPLSRMLGNFYLGFNRPITPTRMFNSEADAAAWLEQFVDGAQP